MGFNLRTSPFFTRLKERVAAGEVGDLGMIGCHAVRFPFTDGYRYTQARSGGTLLEKNCHDFDLFCWFAESDPSRVAAFGGQHVLTEDSDAVDHYDYWGRSRHELDTERQVGGLGGADYLELHRFLRFLRGEADAPATLVEAKRASAIAVAAERAIDEGAVVDIDENYDLG